MHIKEFLSPADTNVEVRAPDKTHLLQELSRQAAASLDLPARQISAEILKREALGSTGTGGGVAIPHARIQGLTKAFGIFARLNKAVDLVFLLLLPANPVGEQLKALAAVARKLRDPACLRELRSASGSAGLYDAM